MMRRTHAFLLALMFAAAPSALAQEVVTGADFTVIVHASASSATIDDVVDRVMAFDLDTDGKVQKAELIDRMQPIVAGGDTDGDGALSEGEIRVVAAAARTAPARTVPFGGMYRMPGPTWFPTRAHIEGLLEDLKLADEAHARALEVIAAHHERIAVVEETALAGLIGEMKNILTSDQLLRFERLTRVRRVVRGGTVAANGTRTMFTMGGGAPDFDRIIDQFGLAPAMHRNARGVVELYEAGLDRKSVEEKDTLVQGMSEILNAEDMESFRASLDRRSAVQLANVFVDGPDVRGIVVTPAPAVLRDVPARRPVVRPISVTVPDER